MKTRANTTVVEGYGGLINREGWSGLEAPKLALLTTTTLTAFNNSAGWKTEADGSLSKDANGNPIYVDSNGKEMSMQSNTIARLNDESKQHRTAKEEAEQRLQAFGDLDPAKAREAVEKLSKLDLSKMVDNGELDRVKSEITSQFTEQLTAKDNALKEVVQRADNLTMQLAFAGSEFINKRIAVPRDMFEASFRNNFKIEDGNIVPYGRDGNKLMSPKNFGEVATVDEAFELLVNQHPNKDAILKADDHNGSGGDGGGGNRGGKRTMTRTEFEKLSPVDRANAAAQMSKGEVTIV